MPQREYLPVWSIIDGSEGTDHHHSTACVKK